MESFPTTCMACPDKCPCLVHVENGRVVEITGHPDSPLNQGFPPGFPFVPFMCEKGRLADLELMYHPQRLLYPLKRAGERGEGKWERISWAEALDTIAQKITEIKGKHGAESLCCTSHGANSRECQLILTLFLRSLGSPNVVANNDICAGAGSIADLVTLGEDIIRPWHGPIELKNAKCVVVVGVNLFSTYPSRWRDILYAKRNGAKVIVVDPRCMEIAERADIHLQLKPGTDGFLALAMARVIINENLYDKEFVEKWCFGFDKFKEHVQPYTLEKAEAITDVPAELIRESARLLAISKPGSMLVGEGKEQQITAVHTTRAYTSLLAITGNIDKPGANSRFRMTKGFQQMRSYILKAKEFNVPEEVQRKRIGALQYPLWTNHFESVRFAHYPSVIKAMLYGDPYWIKFFWAETENMVVDRPNSMEIVSALKNLDFFVASDFQMTPTTELADIVLPQAMGFEYDEINYVPFARSVQIRQKIVNPAGESRYTTDVVLELKRKLAARGLVNESLLPWNTKEEFLAYLLKGSGHNFNDLKRTGFVEAIQPIYTLEKEENFKTPSGKIELWSNTLQKYGYSPLPTWRPAPDSQKPELIKKFPLIMISGTREFIFNKSRYHELDFATKVHPFPLVDIHTNAAKERGIQDGDWVWVIGVAGRCKMKAKVTDKIHPQSVNVPMGWWFPDKKTLAERLESNVNMTLPSGEPYESIMGAPILKSIACDVVKCDVQG